MNRVGYSAATAYGYSNARVKAMESKLLGRDTFVEIAKAPDVASAIGMLLQTDYKDYIEEFGGIDVRSGLIDFALSRNLERNAQKLIAIAPKTEREMAMRIVSKSDAQNMKLVFYAKIAGRGFDDISRYVVESHNIDNETIKRALGEQTIGGAAAKLAVRSPYKRIIEDALGAYSKSGNITEVNAAIDRGFYRLLYDTINRLMGISHESATVLRLDIEMKNITTILRAKRHNMSIEQVNDLLLDKGMSPIESLLSAYEGSKDVGELGLSIKSFDLSHAVELYQTNRKNQMLIFEIIMRKEIFKRAIMLLRHSTLSFGVIVGYFYLKEIEAFTLRVLISGKSYGLSSEEIAEMVVWDL